MQKLTIKATEQLLDLKERLESYGDLSGYYSELYNILSDFGLEDYLSDFETVDDIEYRAKDELESGGLARLYYFMGDVNWNTAELIHIDGYGNCEEASSDDLIDIIDDVVSEYGADTEENTITYGEFGNRLSDKLNELAKKDGFFD